MVSTADELIEVLDNIEYDSEVIRTYQNMTDMQSYSPNSRASRRLLGAHVGSISRAITRPSAEFILSDYFYSLSNVGKADVVRGIMQPAVEFGYDFSSSSTQRFYNNIFDNAGRTARAVTGTNDLERLRAVTANVIDRSLNNEEIYRAESLMSRGYDQIVKNGHRDTILSTVNEYSDSIDQRVIAVRETRSANPCQYCRWHDGTEVRGYQIGDEINKWHDHCHCELAIYFD